MAKFVEVTDAGGHIRHVNPEHVAQVQQNSAVGTRSTLTFADGSSINIEMPATQLVGILESK
jgi:hypothetical protein